tara:strand:- start:222 stop:425 length:204 start_codon:yes stop_codon:yes gene_type:complete
MDAIRSRRARAKALREKKQEQTLLQELSAGSSVCETTTFNNELNKDSKTKRLRMQNAKGTSGMFIKP